MVAWSILLIEMSRLKARDSSMMQISRMVSRIVLPLKVEPLLAYANSEGAARLARFGLAGLMATFFYFVLVNGFVLIWALEAVTASVLAYLLAMLFSYAAQSRFTFRVTDDHGGQVARFVITSLFGLGVSYGVMVLCKDLLNFPYIVGAVAVCVLIPLANYLVFKHWVFARSAEVTGE